MDPISPVTVEFEADNDSFNLDPLISSMVGVKKTLASEEKPGEAENALDELIDAARKYQKRMYGETA